MIQLKMTHILSLVSLTQSCLYSLDIMHLMKCAPDIHQMFETHWSEVSLKLLSLYQSVLPEHPPADGLS